LGIDWDWDAIAVAEIEDLRATITEGD